jgi:hypothetical protein
LIEDATRPIDAEEFRKITEELRSKGCKIIKSDEL